MTSSRRGQTQWKYKMKGLESNGKATTPQETQSPRPQTKFSADMSPALIAQTNWTFVETLLKVKPETTTTKNTIIHYYYSFIIIILLLLILKILN